MVHFLYGFPLFWNLVIGVACHIVTHLKFCINHIFFFSPSSLKILLQIVNTLSLLVPIYNLFYPWKERQLLITFLNNVVRNIFLLWMYFFGSLFFLCRKFAHIFFFYYYFLPVHSSNYERSYSIFPIQLHYYRLVWYNIFVCSFTESILLHYSSNRYY